MILPFQEGVFDELARSCLCLNSFIPIIRFAVKDQGTETTLTIHYAKNKRKYGIAKGDIVETVRGFMDRDPDEKLFEADITHTGLRRFHVAYYKDIKGAWNREKVPVLQFREFVKEEDINMDEDRFNTTENIRNHIASTLNEIEKFPKGLDDLVYEPEILVVGRNIFKPKEEKFNIALGAAYSFLRAKVMTEECLEILVFGGHTYLFESHGFFKTLKNSIEGRHLGQDCNLQLPKFRDGHQISTKEKEKIQKNAIYFKHKIDPEAGFEDELVDQNITIDWLCADESNVIGIEGKVTKYNPETRSHFVKFYSEETDSEDEKIQDGQTGIVEDQWFNLKKHEWQLTDYVNAEVPEFDIVQAVTPTDAMMLIRHIESNQDDSEEDDEDEPTEMLSAILLLASVEDKRENRHLIIQCRSVPYIDTQVAFSPHEAENVLIIADIISKPEIPIIGLLQRAVMYDYASTLGEAVVRNPEKATQKKRVEYASETEDESTLGEAIVRDPESTLEEAIVCDPKEATQKKRVKCALETDDEEKYSTGAEDDEQVKDDVMVATNETTGDGNWVKVVMDPDMRRAVDDFDVKGINHNEEIERQIDCKMQYDKILKKPSEPMCVPVHEIGIIFNPMITAGSEVDEYVKKGKYTTVEGSKKVFAKIDDEDVVRDDKIVERKIRFADEIIAGKASDKPKRIIKPTVIQDGAAAGAATETKKKRPRPTLQGGAYVDISPLKKLAEQYKEAMNCAAGGEAKNGAAGGEKKLDDGGEVTITILD